MRTMKERYFRHLRCINRLMDVYGGDALLVRATYTGPNYDPEVTYTDYPITFLETGYSDEEKRDLVTSTDVAGHIRVSSAITPTNHDRLDIGNGSLSITSITNVAPSPDGETIVYTVRASL